LGLVVDEPKTEAQNPYLIRQMTREDAEAVIALQLRAFPGQVPWKAEQLYRHIEIFPEGQLVAVDEHDRILGSASSLLIDWDDYAESANWSAITGQGTFSTHNPMGKTLYGADMGVDPNARKLGIGTALYEARKELIRERGLKRLLTGGRIAGYNAVAGEMTAREFVADVVAGKRRDPALSFQLENGLVVLDVVPGYMEDTESHGFATVLEWLNPEYTSSVSLQASLQHAALEQDAAESLRGTPRPRRVRIAAVQYLLRPIASFEDFARQVEFFVHTARDYKANFILFPEFFTMQLLSYINEPAPALAVRRLARLRGPLHASSQGNRNLHHWRNPPRNSAGKGLQRRAPVHAQWPGLPPEKGSPHPHREWPLPIKSRAWTLRLPHRLWQHRHSDLLRRRVSRGGPRHGRGWRGDSLCSFLHRQP
jgi:GNAT superfamily N-acetyltransferase